MRKGIVGISLLMLCSCNRATNNLGEYVFEEVRGDYDIMHSRMNCSKIEGGVSIYKLTTLKSDPDLVCPECFTEQLYKELEDTIKKHNK